MKVPSQEAILKYAPHGGAMRWVESVLALGPSAGECEVVVRADGHYMGADGLRPSSLIEFIAQSFGLINIAQELSLHGDQAKPTSKRAFLASFNDVDWGTTLDLASLKEGDRLAIKIDGLRRIGPITSFRGQVLHGSTLLCDARMKVYTER